MLFLSVSEVSMTKEIPTFEAGPLILSLSQEPQGEAHIFLICKSGLLSPDFRRTG